MRTDEWPNPKEEWEDIQNGNHVEARNDRRVSLNRFSRQLQEWIGVLKDHPQGGPSKQEMSGIVASLRRCLDSMTERD